MQYYPSVGALPTKTNIVVVAARRERPIIEFEDAASATIWYQGGIIPFPDGDFRRRATWVVDAEICRRMEEFYGTQNHLDDGYHDSYHTPEKAKK